MRTGCALILLSSILCLTFNFRAAAQTPDPAEQARAASIRAQAAVVQAQASAAQAQALARGDAAGAALAGQAAAMAAQAGGSGSQASLDRARAMSAHAQAVTQAEEAQKRSRSAGAPQPPSTSPRAEGKHDAAAVYHVDSRNGSDDNDGLSPQSAWRSLERVNQKTFRPGDRILFRAGGMWRGQLRPRGSGVEGSPIVVDKFGEGPKPIIAAMGESEDALYLYDVEFWEINNLELTNHGEEPGRRRGAHIVNHLLPEMRHIVLRSLDIHDVNGAEDNKYNAGVLWESWDSPAHGRLQDVVVEGLRLWRVDRTGVTGGTYGWKRSNWRPSRGVVIRDNILDDIGGDGIVPTGSEHPLVERNIVSNANRRANTYNAGIWPWSADDAILRNNEAFLTRGYLDGEGFDSDWNTQRTVIENNYSHDNEGGFLLICNDGEQTPIDSIGNVGSIVRGNVSRNDHLHAIHVTGPVRDAVIEDNAIDGADGVGGRLLVVGDWHGWAKSLTLRNNRFLLETPFALAHDAGGLLGQEGPGEAQNIQFRDNLYAPGVASAPEKRQATTPAAAPALADAFAGDVAAVADSLLAVDGEAIDAREFALHLNNFRAQVFEEFARKYNVADSPTFWTTPHEGLTPRARLIELAARECARDHVRLRLAQGLGHLKNANYPSYLASLQEENRQRRDAALGRGGRTLCDCGHLVGPAAFSPESFWNYRLLLLDLAVWQDARLRELEPTPQEVDAQVAKEIGDKAGRDDAKQLRALYRSRLREIKYWRMVDAQASAAKIAFDGKKLSALPLP